MRPSNLSRNGSRLGRLAPLLVAAGLVASACTSTASAGWTFEPPPPTASPAAASGGASAAPSASAGVPATASPGAPASSSPGAPASATAGAPASGGAGGTGGTVLKIKAQNIAFDVSSLSAPAGQPFQIDFDNEDQGTQHDVAIKDASGALPFRGDLVTGIAQTTYNVPALPAGTYTFMCVVHPAMTGTLDVR
jgi:plastocyanin